MSVGSIAEALAATHCVQTRTCRHTVYKHALGTQIACHIHSVLLVAHTVGYTVAPHAGRALTVTLTAERGDTLLVRAFRGVFGGPQQHHVLAEMGKTREVQGIEGSANLTAQGQRRVSTGSAQGQHRVSTGSV